MSFANNICHKAQLSVQAYLVAAAEAADPTLTTISAANIFAGIDDRSVTAERIVCICKNAENEETLTAGNWWADVDIVTRVPFADMESDNFHDLCSEVWAHFSLSRETMLTGISNADIEFTAFEVYKRNQSWDEEPGADGQPAEWVSNLKLQIKCCGSVVG